MKKTIECPESMRPHVTKVLNGEYSIDYDPKAGIILDIGANVGAFALWATMRWPNASIFCYEPSKENFEFLSKNIRGIPNIHINNFAVGNSEHTKLFKGKNNCGESSFFQIGEQAVASEQVITKSPEVLPKNANILKVDTEGCELEILNPLIKGGHLPDVIMCEYHSEKDRREIDSLLSNYMLVGSWANRAQRGIVKYIRVVDSETTN